MFGPRIIPCLLLKDDGLVKTTKFKEPQYLGDPINIIKIFNEKEVDELVLLDIEASRKNGRPPFNKLAEIVGECFMPLCYGGGIREIEDIKKIFALGVEKIVINSYAVEEPAFVRKAADLFGSQSIVVSVDVKKNVFGGYNIYIKGGQKKVNLAPVAHCLNMQAMGAGELLVNSIDRDGTMAGYDLSLINEISQAVSIPVIACGGAGAISHFSEAIKESGASAVAAGSMFVFQGKHRAVLISYPAPQEIAESLK